MTSTSVIFAFWRNVASSTPMPVQRLHDHFIWNDPLYSRSGVQVYAVTDQPYEVPPYVECVIIPPSDMPHIDGEVKFSLARAKNAGIQVALDDGAETVIVTDPDIAWTNEAWQASVNVSAESAVIPVYWMAYSYRERLSDCLHANTLVHAEHCRGSHADGGATGTIAMNAEHWQTLRYDNRAWGYGFEDGLILRAIKRGGVRIERGTKVYHIAHDASQPQVNFSGVFVRRDTWDVATNPINFAENRKLRPVCEWAG